MRALLVAAILMAACGFKASGGQGLPDGPTPTDAQGGDGSPGDGPTDGMLDGSSGPQCPPTYGAPPSAAGSKYRFVASPQAWDVAEADCADDAQGGARATHLIVLDNNPELTLMIGGLTGNAMLQDQWVGATDLAAEGQYLYVTNQATTLTLNPSPNNATKDCVRIKMDGTEEGRSCAEANKYVCECDGIAPDPARFPNFPNGN